MPASCHAPCCYGDHISNEAPHNDMLLLLENQTVDGTRL